jgi:GAF domain-containing protein
LNVPPKPFPEAASEPTREALLAALAERDRELAEAREREAATSEVMEAINSSLGDLEVVFDAIVERAMRLCGTAFGATWIVEGDRLRSNGRSFMPEPLSEYAGLQAFRLTDVFGRALEDRRFLHVADLSATKAYRDKNPFTVAVVELGRVKTFLAAPLREDGVAVGVVMLWREEVRPFTDRQIALVQSFAAQAEIALRNTRLMNETKQALERQTATAEVLRVIAGSPSDVQPVFEAIATNANRLVGGLTTAVWRFANDEGHLAAFTPTNPAADAALKAMSPLPFARLPLFARVLDGEAAAIVDTETDTTPALRDFARLRGYRSMLFTPLMSQGAAIGAFSVTRKEPGSFAPHHIQLLRTFADQAVIAIQNTRLFNETQEALQQQTATADVLKVISRSAFDLQTVLETLIHSAVELCAANRGAVFLRDGDVFRWRAATGSGDEYAAYMRAHPQSGGRGSTVGRVILSGKVECISDVLDDPEFMLPANALVQTRATLGAPLLRDGKVEGVLVLTRHTPGPFTLRQIELVETFADQAVIAIENVRLFDEVQARTRDLTEALQQQTATTDVLKVISRSAFDLDAVLNTLTETAIQLCEATRGVIWLRKGEQLRLAAHVNSTEEWAKAASEFAITPAANATTASGIAAFTGEVVNIDDMLADPRFQSLPAHQLGDYRGVLAVPMYRDGEVVGVITLSRPEARHFSDRQVALVKAFADQAVIAINNVGLFNETQEALRQQTATADVLKVISRSAFDLQAVFDTLLGSAVALSGADSGVLAVRDGDAFRCRSFVNKSPDLVRFLTENPITPGSGSVMGRVALSGRIEWIEDTLADSALAMRTVIARTNDDRALVGVPLLREGRIEGAIVLGRREPGRFSDRSIGLTQTFADQAVIAIENVRLFDEVQARTRDLTESLEQQTAAAEILRVISSSPTDLRPVFDAIARSASELCEGSSSQVFLYRNGVIDIVAHHKTPDEALAGALSTFPAPPDPGTASGRAILRRAVIHIPDIAADPEYSASSIVKAGLRTILSVPMLRNGEPIGVINATRTYSRSYTDRQIELLKTFADQAVIAINNVGLFNETQEALKQQTATADVLKVISRSAFDLQTVFDTLLGSAVELSGADGGALCIRDGDGFRYKSFNNKSPDLVRSLRELPTKPGQESLMGRVAASGQVEWIEDARADSRLNMHAVIARTDDDRALVGVPLLRDGRVEGAIVLTRREPGRFSARAIDLVQTFADQAVIAIENVRLFDEVQARTHDLTESLQQQTATADVLKAISRTAFDLDTVLETLISTAVRLCNANHGQIFRRHGDVYRYAASQMVVDPMYLRHEQTAEIKPGRGTLIGRVALENRTVVIVDAWNDPEYSEKAEARTGNVRAMLGVPLLRGGVPIGAFALARSAPVPFTQRQVELVTTFADQAVIAIENVRLFDEVQARTRDLSEALQQQTATADVLKVISRSVFDLDTVLQTLIDTAVRLTHGSRGTIFIKQGDVLVARAFHRNVPDSLRGYLASTAWSLDGDSHMARAAREGRVVHISDLSQSDKESDEETRKRAAFGAGLWAPLMRDGQAIGVFGVPREEPIAFSDREIELVKTFADQAVIAIENARLFEQVQARTRDLSESLQQQTATADVLKVISRSAFDLQAVFDTLIASAVELCGANRGAIFLRDKDVFRLRAASASSPEYFDYWRAHPAKAGRGSATARVILSGKIESISDVLEDGEMEMPATTLIQIRATLGVPLLRDNQVEGVLVLTRPQPGVFTPRQVDLVQTFADQAVIAIENARLFNEVKARTDDLSEALRQQTATADVLKVISRSAFDLQAVLDTLVESAVSLIGAASGVIWLRDGDVFNVKAVSGADDQQEFFAQLRTRPQKPGRHSIGARVLLTGEVQIVSDIKADPEYDLVIKAATNARTLLGVPLLRDGVIIGAFVLALHELGTFTPRQIELVQTFADQAVIAIENVRLFEEVQARTRDLSEALQQQTATADVLKVISRSAFDLDTVLQTLVESAARLCNAPQGVIHLREGDIVKAKAMVGHSAELMQRLRDTPRRPGRESIVPRVMLSGRVEHIADVLDDAEFDLGGMDRNRLGFRALLGVPLLREGKVEGVFVITSPHPGRFTDRQTELVQTFADQAVIAIENVRLFNEVQSKTDDLSEALQQQTATADVLKVISRSAFNLQAVLDTLVESAYRLSGAAYGLIYLKTGEDFECKAIGGMGAEEGDALFKGRPIRAGRSTVAERVISTGEVQSIPDLFEDPEFDPKIKAAIRGASSAFASLRSLIAVPMKRDDAVVGVIVIARSQSGLLPARQLELLQTFADQAVIAIENVRLFDEVQARTRDLSEALQQQTATADVLKVISRSAFGLKTVLQTLVDSAVRLCASDGVIYLRHGDVFRAEAAFGANIAGHDARNRSPRRAGRDSVTGRVALSGRVEQIPDNRADSEFKVAPGQRMNMRALLGVPLLRDGEVEGVFVLGKPEPGLFSDRAVELVRTFADQAVIAIQNVRLFDAVQAKTKDLEESLQLQTATSDVLKVISRSAFDLQAVFDTLIASAVELCAAFSGSICVRDGDVFRYTGSAGAGNTVALHNYLEQHPATPGRASMVGRVLLSGKVERIRDRLEDEEYAVPTAAFGNISRAFLGVPLLGKGGIEGALVLTREEPGYFTDRQIEIVQTFADQAVIAIENVRLFDEVQARTRELAASLDDLRKTQDRLIQSEKLASLGQLTAGIAHEIKNPLNFVNNFSALSRELIDELAELLEKAPLQTDQRQEASELIGMVSANLEKVVQHGKRADSIVKNMLLHSREGSGERSSVKVNAMVEEALNLAYHGARAEKPGFNVTIVKSLAPDAGAADLYAQEMTRVLLNLISNGFYATTKRRQGESNEGYEPTITASTRDLGHSVEIAIRDNGTGIPEEVKAKMFNPFFTTKPAGEGTGLGLSLSHDIVVKQHGGTLEVSTEPGAYTQFTIVLPRESKVRDEK